jgi:flagellar hook-basal body complex protein FliE
MALSPIRPCDTPSPSLDELQPAQAPSEGGFVKVIDHLLGKASETQARADHAIEDLVLGRTDNLHSVMLAVAQADLAFRTILEIRNRLSDAFQEIMRMQV